MISRTEPPRPASGGAPPDERAPAPAPAPAGGPGHDPEAGAPSALGRQARHAAGRQGAARRPKAAQVVRRESRRQTRAPVEGGARILLLVLACTPEDTIGVDVGSGAVMRLRVPWPEGHEPDLSAFDVVEANLASDPERDDLARPDAYTAGGLPRQVGTLRGWRARRILARLSARPDGPLFGFRGPSAAYWEFRGLRPSVALLHPPHGVQLLRRPADASTWARFNWARDHVWLPVEDPHAVRALDASRQGRLAGKALATALGYAPYYLLAAISAPRQSHCYKVCAALLPRG